MSNVRSKTKIEEIVESLEQNKKFIENDRDRYQRQLNEYHNEIRKNKIPTASTAAASNLNKQISNCNHNINEVNKLLDDLNAQEDLNPQDKLQKQIEVLKKQESKFNESVTDGYLKILFKDLQKAFDDEVRQQEKKVSESRAAAATPHRTERSISFHKDMLRRKPAVDIKRSNSFSAPRETLGGGLVTDISDSTQQHSNPTNQADEKNKAKSRFRLLTFLSKQAKKGKKKLKEGAQRIKEAVTDRRVNVRKAQTKEDIEYVKGTQKFPTNKPKL